MDRKSCGLLWGDWHDVNVIATSDAATASAHVHHTRPRVNAGFPGFQASRQIQTAARALLRVPCLHPQPSCPCNVYLAGAPASKHRLHRTAHGPARGKVARANPCLWVCSIVRSRPTVCPPASARRACCCKLNLLERRRATAGRQLAGSRSRPRRRRSAPRIKSTCGRV